MLEPYNYWSRSSSSTMSQIHNYMYLNDSPEHQCQYASVLQDFYIAMNIIHNVLRTCGNHAEQSPHIEDWFKVFPSYRNKQRVNPLFIKVFGDGMGFSTKVMFPNKWSLNNWSEVVMRLQDNSLNCFWLWDPLTSLISVFQWHTLILSCSRVGWQ